MLELDLQAGEEPSEVFARLDGAWEVRVLEPSPPACSEAPWFADDPVARGDVAAGRRVVSPARRSSRRRALCVEGATLARVSAAGERARRSTSMRRRRREPYVYVVGTELVVLEHAALLAAPDQRAAALEFLRANTWAAASRRPQSAAISGSAPIWPIRLTTSISSHSSAI